MSFGVSEKIRRQWLIEDFAGAYQQLSDNGWRYESINCDPGGFRLDICTEKDRVGYMIRAIRIISEALKGQMGEKYKAKAQNVLLLFKHMYIHGYAEHLHREDFQNNFIKALQAMGINDKLIQLFRQSPEEKMEAIIHLSCEVEFVERPVSRQLIV